MKTKIGAVIMVGLFLAGTAPVAMAKGPGGGSGRGAAVRSGSGTQNPVRAQQRLRDGSCVNQGTGTSLKKGNTYGPGDGTGTGVPVKDGTGYGAPANR